MNTELMVKVQQLIYNNQDRLEALVEALESVCEEINTVVTPEVKEPYRITEKDVGSLVQVEGVLRAKVVTSPMLSEEFVYSTRDGFYTKEDFTPYLDPIKLHFKPFTATETSQVPDDLGKHHAILWSHGGVSLHTYSPSKDCWKGKKSDFHPKIVGYCPLQFVNTVLEK